MKYTKVLFLSDRKNILHSRGSQSCWEKKRKRTPEYSCVHRPRNTEAVCVGELTFVSGSLNNFKSDLDAHLLSNEKDLLQIHCFNFILLYVAVFLNTKNQF